MSIVRHLALLLSKQTCGQLAKSTNNIVGHRFGQSPRLLTSLHQFSVQFQSPDGHRSFHTTGVRCESALGKLRKKTGYAFSLCRKALELNDQDFARAEKWLRAEAIKQGWEKAQKVKSRNTGEGLVGIFTSANKDRAAMVEVKCETDFVAKNELFSELVAKLAHLLADSAIPQSADARDAGDCLQKMWIVDERKLNEIGGEAITAAIGKLGENIRFVRGCIVRIQNQKSADNDTCPVLLPYTHAVAGKIESKDPSVALGKYGTIVAIQKRPPSETVATEVAEGEETPEDGIGVTSLATVEDIAAKLGQHIIGLCPLSLAPSEQLEPPEPDAIGDEEPTALLKQKFIFNDEITVEQFLRNSNAKVLDFVRFECGESVDKDD